MQVLHTIREIKEFRLKLQREGAIVGFVPTMGYLHEGHLSLVKQARKDCDVVVVSIFVNPTQFSASEDFSTYPRDTVRDIQLLEAAGVHAVFIPEATQIYPPGFSTYVNVDGIEDTAEAKSRPHFFRGVATVVTKLFNIIQPDKAYFGQKDAVQCVVVQKLVRDLNMQVEIVVCETVREHDGLAMSSRNAYLNNDERKIAPILYRALSAGAALYHQENVRDREKIIARVQEILREEPRVALDYVSLASRKTGQELNVVGQDGAILSGAIKIGRTRLIDNVVLL